MRIDRLISTTSIETGDGSVARDSTPAKRRPLVVDLDEVLRHPHLSTDVAIAEIAARPSSLIGVLAAAVRGKTTLKRRIARSKHFDPARLLYNTETTTALLRPIREGRPVYLVSANYERPLLEAIARYLGILPGWSASDEPAAVQSFQQTFGALGFDRFGHEAAQSAAASDITRSAGDAKETQPQADWRTWAKLFRVHQYAKNGLVFVPLLTAHQFAVLPTAKALLAAVAFSLCASGAYILNDLVDVTADRAHPSKRYRPLASGSISPARAVVAMVLLLASSIATALSVSLAFFGILVGYLALTTAYSFWLKRIMLADVVTLAMLYTVRVIAGSIALDVVMSEWLFAFSLFIFMSLALVKRYIELASRPAEDQSTLLNRDYHAGDQAIVAVLAAAAGFNAVVVFTLYISSETVRALYTRPQMLWIACPILIYWIARVVMLAHRRMIDDDPVLFALRDRVSWLTIIALGAIMLIAI